MDSGLSQADITLIKRVFANDPKVDQVIIFGSRAMGNYKTGSDIDLALVGDKITFNDLLEIGAELEKIGSLYRFDLQNFNKIKDPDVIDHIRRAGKIFYSINEAKEDTLYGKAI